MATLEEFTPNGWQRAALLVAGIAIAVGTFEGADLNGGMGWIVGALVSTVLVVTGLKGVTSGRGPVLTVIAIVSVITLVLFVGAFVLKIQELTSERAAESAQAEAAEAKRTLQANQWGLLMQSFNSATLAALDSKILTLEEQLVLLNTYRRELARQSTRLVDQERAAGHDVRMLDEMAKRLQAQSDMSATAKDIRSDK